MNGTVADLVRIVIERTALPRTYVQQRARCLQAGGVLPIGEGSKSPRATPADVVTLMLGLASDKARQAPHIANALGSLRQLGACDPYEKRSADCLVKMVSRLWAGDKSDVLSSIEIIQHPELKIVVRGEDGHSTYFYAAETILANHSSDVVRRSLLFPAKTIAAIGADLGIRSCNYAR